ncbi:MAG: hypothetical protein J6Y02_22930 [Pseudobutyrivibrio sp.]|nr:hypothetical protein [Pseudobutyrivibrio sp.]
MKVLLNTKDRMEEELDHLNRKEQLTKEDVCIMGELVDMLKDIETVEAMKEASAQGYSRDYGMDYSRGYDDDYSNAYRYSYDGRGRDGRYSETGSYARGRDSMGRYTSRDEGYSRHSKDEMIKHLEQLMMNARTPEERENYRATIDQMSK